MFCFKDVIFFIIILCHFHIYEAIVGQRFWKFRQIVEQNQRERTDAFLLNQYALKGYARSPVETFFLEQPLDHFNALSKQFGKTYKQRYYVNAEYWFNADSPVFLYIGGEGTLTARSVEAGEIAVLAQKHNALLLAVEHRFYGASLNDDGLQLEELQYLSSQQALADLATFIEFSKGKYGISNIAPWICFGGSYPGALSAWFRLKYPHLVHGAVASSAPVQAITNFEGYNEVVAASLKNSQVGGSQKCLDAIAVAFNKIDDMILYTLYDQLATDFKSCNNITQRLDTVQFVSNLAGLIMGVVQYNNEIAGQNISHVCDVMLSTNDAYSNLIKLNQEFMDIATESCVDNSYANYTATMMNTTVDRGTVGVGIRQWTYQTCAQFGYYQTCDHNTSCPFSHLMDLQDSDLLTCQTVFKTDPADIYTNVQFTNDYYGGNHTQQSKIVFVNGSIDPWHWLSILTNQTQFGEFSVFIPGTAHCADLRPQQPSDTIELQEARNQIASFVSQFIQEARKNLRQ